MNTEYKGYLNIVDRSTLSEGDVAKIQF